MRFSLWLFLIALICLAGFADVLMQGFSLHDLKKSIQDKKRVLQKNEENHAGQKTAGHRMPVVTKDRMMNLFLKEADAYGLLLRSFSIDENANDSQNYFVDAALAGSFQAVPLFFDSMMKTCFPFLIQEISMVSAQDHPTWKMHLVLSDKCLAAKPVLLEKKDLQPAALFSVREMRMTGFLKYRDRYHAIVLLPDHESLEVDLNDRLGIEHARVVHIDEKNVWIRLNGTDVHMMFDESVP